MLKGQILYDKPSGSQIIFDEIRDEVIYAHVKADGEEYESRSLTGILAKGYWNEVYISMDVETVMKHGEHDQSSHGNWADGNFNEESEYDSALMVYSERYGVDREGNVVGATAQEHRAIDDYSQEGYKRINSYLRNPRGYQDEGVIEIIKADVEGLDTLIDKSPDMFGDKTLYRVIDNYVLNELSEGDIMIDKGFLSTSRIDLTQDKDARDWIGEIYETPDTVAVILPSPTKSGKGIAVDIYRTSVNDTSSSSDREKEVLLPRNTPLQFIGYKTDVGSEAKVAVFQRMDK